MNISASGSAVIEVAPMSKSSNSDAHPLFVAGFIEKRIQQSTVSTGAVNTISVTFALNRDFEYEGAPIITISGKPYQSTSLPAACTCTSTSSRSPGGTSGSQG